MLLAPVSAWKRPCRGGCGEPSAQGGAAHPLLAFTRPPASAAHASQSGLPARKPGQASAGAELLHRLNEQRRAREWHGFAVEVTDKFLWQALV